MSNLPNEERTTADGRVTEGYLLESIDYWTKWIGIKDNPSDRTHGWCALSMARELLELRAEKPTHDRLKAELAVCRSRLRKAEALKS